jgi:hypothetical protein
MYVYVHVYLKYFRRVMSSIYFLCVSYLTMLLVSSLYSIDDTIIKEYGTVRGIKIGRGNGSSLR